MNTLLSIWIALFGVTVSEQNIKTIEFENVTNAIYREFGADDFCMAYAIFRSESGLVPSREGDNGSSIGIAQINLPAHGKKIPGKTIDEKKAWLKNFQNNIHYAKQIKDKSGFYPWSNYKNGNYEVFYNPNCLQK